MPDLNPGDGGAAKLKTYWVRGPGAALIIWGTPGDFDRCVAQLSRFVEPGIVKGLCSNYHFAALGVRPGQEH